MTTASIFFPSWWPRLTGYSNQTHNVTFATPSGVTVRYARASEAGTDDSAEIADPHLSLDLMPLLRGALIPHTLRFQLTGLHYYDRDGMLYHSMNPNTGSGTPAGTINYTTGIATITAWAAGEPSFTIQSGLVQPASLGMAMLSGRTAAAPLKSQSLYLSAVALDGTQITATSAADGTVSGAQAKGTVDIETGTYKVAFGATVAGEWVPKLIHPSSVRYNTVAYSYLPLDASIIGLDPVRLPQDGRVPIFRKGDFAVLGHTGTVGPSTVSNGQTINCGRARLSRVRVLGADGNVINTGYTADLEAGTATFSNVAGYSQPVTIEHRIEDMAQISDVQINGDLTFTRQISHAYPEGSVISSALLAGDLHSRVSVLFDQASWTSAWQDTLSGSPATATYNDVLSPIEVTNIGASNERWAVVFTNTTAFNVIGEHVGVIATGNTSTDLAPVNPATSEPYFTLRAAGWGNGWSAGNVLRFNTVGALFPVWVVRTIQQGPETVTDDAFTLLTRGDVDRP